MPKEYDLTLCYNVRAYSKTVIEAESFEDAKAKGLKYWTEGETDYDWMATDYGDEADALEPVIWVNDSETGVDEEAEFIDPGYVYRVNLLTFAQKAAALSLTCKLGATDTEVLHGLIIEARKVLGIK